MLIQMLLRDTNVSLQIGRHVEELSREMQPAELSEALFTSFVRHLDAAAAREHAAAVEALLNKGLNENQRAFYPYLLGYNAFFARDYRQAIDELVKGDQTDPFVLGLIAQAHERLGRRDLAADYYRKVMAITTHSINAAFARPKARAFLR
jgi:tetratricopeptide (TPR) repeat protein